ncbi:MAG: CBS domain-containing protein [Oceanospirillaceae bacterium]|nr:CBS domain-containing protein [Oceanospirillaceae bacterium]
MKNITVKDIMSTDFAKVSTDMPVVEASMELIKKEVLGGPVVDNNNQLLGWISEQECLQVITKVVYHNERVATVNDIMQVDVLTVAEDQSVLSLAEKMNSAQPKNYPVVDHSNKVIGVITRRRVLESMLGLI